MAVVAHWRRMRDTELPRGHLAAQRPQSGGGMAPGMVPGTPMVDCESVMRQLWDYLDGELTSDRMTAIRGHIELCKRCYPQYEFEQSFLAAVAARGQQHSAPQQLRARVSDALRAQGLRDA